MAQDTFLWVALVYEELAKTAAWNMLQKLTTFRWGLGLLYGRNLQVISGLYNAKLGIYWD